MKRQFYLYVITQAILATIAVITISTPYFIYSMLGILIAYIANVTYTTLKGI
ncbi:MAG: hypothetical protein ACTSRG_25070 [Candidatus Helarchaeota archaeon]